MNEFLDFEGLDRFKEKYDDQVEQQLQAYVLRSDHAADLARKQDVIDRIHPLSADLVDDTTTVHKFVSDAEKMGWNAKYDKPQGGIPDTDLASDVQQILTDAQAAASAAQSATQTATAAASSATTAATEAQAAATQAAHDVAQLIADTDAVLGAENIPQFSTSATYHMGDFVMHEGALYKFITSHNPGAWNAAEVQQTDLVTEVDNMVKSDYEQVVIILKTESDAPLANVFVAVTVEGEQGARNLTTDSTGRCTTNIQKGLEYTVSCAYVPYYYEIADITRRASLPIRYMGVVYIEDSTLTKEHVSMAFTYSSNYGTADWVHVTYDGEVHTVAIVNNVAEFDVRIGKEYIITFEDIEGYRTPTTQTHLASLHGTRAINVRYQAAIAGYRWLMKDNTELEINGVSRSDYENDRIFGLIVAPSELMEDGCAYVIPISYLFATEVISGQWLSANVQVPAMPYYSNHGESLADRDGEGNCDIIEQFIANWAEQGTIYTSSMVTNCRHRCGGAPTFSDLVDYKIGDYVVHGNHIHCFQVAHPAGVWREGETIADYGYLMPDGVVKKCFQAAYGQIYPFRLNYNAINSFTEAEFGKSCINILRGTWWSSTQNNAYNGVGLYSGAFSSSLKTNNYTVLPVLAY